MAEGSWTSRFGQYLADFAANKTYHEPKHFENGKWVPKIRGFDGQAIVKMDGPYAAPTQHLGEFRTVMVVGAGIGVTPLRATMQSVVFHRWRYSTGTTYPDHFYGYWCFRWTSLEAYRFMIRSLKEIADRMTDMRSKFPSEMADKKIHIYINVTRAKKGATLSYKPIMSPRMGSEQDYMLWGPPTRVKGQHGGLTEQKGKNARESRFSKAFNYDSRQAPQNSLTSPTQAVNATDMSNVTRATATWTEDTLYNALRLIGDTKEAHIGEYITIRAGRPNWGSYFEDVAGQHHGGDMGVMYCGPEVIADALQDACGEHTNLTTGTRFKFYKENF